MDNYSGELIREIEIKDRFHEFEQYKVMALVYKNSDDINLLLVEIMNPGTGFSHSLQFNVDWVDDVHCDWLADILCRNLVKAISYSAKHKKNEIKNAYESFMKAME